MRWEETDGEAICPRCGCCDTYTIATRRKFKCKGCYHQFSVTSGTIFASRKDNGSLAYGLVQNAMGSPVSRTWKGYWQRAS